MSVLGIDSIKLMKMNLGIDVYHFLMLMTSLAFHHNIHPKSNDYE